MMMSTAIRIPAKLPRDVAIAVAATSKKISDFVRESLPRNNEVPRTIC